MEFFQKFQVVQFLVILAACIIGTLKLGKTSSPERKYILPFCYIDLVVTGVSIYNYYIGEEPMYLHILVFLFTCCEVIFLSFYISAILNKKIKYFVPSAFCIISLIASIILFKSLITLPYLTTELYLSYFGFLYIKWLFLKKDFFILKHTNHYWIVIGIILCYTASIPYWIADVLIKSSGIFELHRQYTLILFIAYIAMNIFMFILFIKGFLCQKQQTYFFGASEVR